MRYRIEIPGFKKQKLEIESPGFLSRASLWGDDQVVLRDPKTGRFKLRTDAGKEVSAAWKQQGIGLDIPQLEVDGTI